MWEFLKGKLDRWEGRIWNWAGDGGIVAFRGEENVPRAVSCGMEILSALPVFNMQPDKPIKDEIYLRIALDFGPLKFFSDTGKDRLRGHQLRGAPGKERHEAAQPQHLRYGAPAAVAGDAEGVFPGGEVRGPPGPFDRMSAVPATLPALIP